MNKKLINGTRKNFDSHTTLKLESNSQQNERKMKEPERDIFFVFKKFV